MPDTPAWLEVTEGDSALLLSIPHSGTQIPTGLHGDLISPTRSTCDADWWVDRLYDFAPPLGATLVRTSLSRTVVDLNRDPSGRSLYPGQATTELCPTTTFEGLPLYRPGCEPDAAQIARRTREYFLPYHAALTQQLARLRSRHPRVVLYDCHSIRSRIPRLFAGELPQFNIGTFEGRSCDAQLRQGVTSVCAASGASVVVDGRFKGGYITRHYGAPATGVHAVQMELACRGYLEEPGGEITEHNWPAPYVPQRAAAMRAILKDVLAACLSFAQVQTPPQSC